MPLRDAPTGRLPQQPEAYIGGADKLFDAQGNLTNDSTRAFLQKYLDAFAAWVERNAVATKESPGRTSRRDERAVARH